jgi:hypothetical protein
MSRLVGWLRYLGGCLLVACEASRMARVRRAMRAGLADIA